MEQKRPHDIADLRRQRERIRRISTGVLLVALVTLLGSCDALVRRDAGSRPSAAAAHAVGSHGLSYAPWGRSPTDHGSAHS
jgi:hypothetical protein